VANRTVDKKNNPLARSSALPEDEMAVADTDQAQDESSANAGEDDASQEEMPLAVAPSGDEDEDLRISGSAISTSAPRPVARGRGVPPWVMANPITRYIAESVIELLKVTWPEPRYAWNMTWVVIGVSVAVAIVLGAADFGLNHLVTWLITTSAAGGGPAPTPTPVVPIQP
jgi:preprotein translocase SecE subunit